MTDDHYYLDFYIQEGTTTFRADDYHRPVKTVEEARELIDKHGIPQGILTIGLFYQKDNPTAGHYQVSRLMSYLRDVLEQRERGHSQALEHEIKFESAFEFGDIPQEQVDENNRRAKSFYDDVAFLNDHYSPRNVRLRRHHRVMNTLGPRFEAFVRNGRWGTCTDCGEIRLADGRMLKTPETCKNTHRSDHHFDLTDLVDQYNREMSVDKPE